MSGLLYLKGNQSIETTTRYSIQYHFTFSRNIVLFDCLMNINQHLIWYLVKTWKRSGFPRKLYWSFYKNSTFISKLLVVSSIFIEHQFPCLANYPVIKSNSYEFKNITTNSIWKAIVHKFISKTWKLMSTNMNNIIEITEFYFKFWKIRHPLIIINWPWWARWPWSWPWPSSGSEAPVVAWVAAVLHGGDGGIDVVTS